MQLRLGRKPHAGTFLAGGHGWKVSKKKNVLPRLATGMNLFSLKRGIDGENIAPAVAHQCRTTEKKQICLRSKRPGSCFTASRAAKRPIIHGQISQSQRDQA